MGKKAKGSRKGKKAWRANISTEEIEDFFEKSTKDALSGGSLQALSSDSLFYEDKSKDLAVKKKIEKHRERVLHCDSLLQKKCSKNRKTVSNVKVVNQYDNKDESTMFDLWNDKGEDNKQVKKVSKPTLIPEVEVDPPGCSFNPSFESHQDTLASAVAEEMQKVYKKELGPEPVPLTVPGEAIAEEDMYFLDVDDGNDDDDSNLENEDENEDAASDKNSFDLHLQHNLSKEEIDCKSNVKFSWETPAVGMKNCKWIGTGENIMEDLDISSCHGLKAKLSEHWMDVYKTSGGKDISSPKQSMFFSLCSSYRDILYCNKRPFYFKGLEDASIMDAYIMHSLNHVFRTRDSVKKNDAKLTKLKEYTESDKFRDQGFTRPKVLILLPLASIMYRVVKRLIHLTPSAYKVNVEHKDRFTTKFGSEEHTSDIENVDDENAKPHKSSKASDFQMLFGGNNEDDFMIGIKFTRKTIKLFSDFHTSDIIIASALCLVNKIEEVGINKEKDVDFLSSIEVLIIDHADVISMQNWSHVHTIIEHLNRLPSKQPGTDVMRIRPWYLDDHARFYRQTIILGFYSNPDINASFNHHCVNYEGKVKLMCEFKGVLHKVLPEIRQIYERFDVDSIVQADDARFDYFITKVFPRIKDLDQGGTMLFTNSYFEFIRLRNFLKSQNASFCLLGEYTTQSDISRARLWFYEGSRKVMLYTERSHFYHRYKIRGVQNLIIYSLPERKEFYPEIVNMLYGSNNMTCTVLFSCLDKLRLERIVGTTPTKRMVAAEKGVFVFCH